MDQKKWLEIKNLSVTRNNNFLIKNINLELFTNEIVTILGPNGSGKSTLLKLITRSIHPIVKKDATIKIFGREKINIWDLRRKISIVSDEINLRIKKHLTVNEIIMSALYGTVGYSNKLTPSRQDLEKLDNHLKLFNISSIAKKKYSELSDGKKRIVLISRALIIKPEILILDEPTINLDLKSYFELYEFLNKLYYNGTTIVMATNKLESILKNTTRLIFIKNGEIIDNGKPEELLKTTKINQLFNTNLELINIKGNLRLIPK